MARVLVMDDEPNIARVLEEILRDEGHEVQTAPNGQVGLEKLKRDPLPEIILMDLSMPVMNGRQVVEAIRSDDRLKHIPVMIISGSLKGDDVFPPEGSYQAFIRKPFDILVVLETLQKLTNN